MEIEQLQGSGEGFGSSLLANRGCTKRVMLGWKPRRWWNKARRKNLGLYSKKFKKFGAWGRRKRVHRKVLNKTVLEEVKKTTKTPLWRERVVRGEITPRWRTRKGN